MRKGQEGWLVRIGYVSQSQELTWGEFHHSQKSKAREVWRKLGRSAYRAQLLKDGVLVCEMEGPETLTCADPAEFGRFLNA